MNKKSNVIGSEKHEGMYPERKQFLGNFRDIPKGEASE